MQGPKASGTFRGSESLHDESEQHDSLDGETGLEDRSMMCRPTYWTQSDFAILINGVG